MPGVARAFIDRLGELPQIQIKVDRARAARYGLNVGDVQDVIETALGGKQATQMWEGEKRISASRCGWPSPSARSTRMQAMLVATPDGAYVPLSEIAEVPHHRRHDEHRARERQAGAGDRRVHPRPRHGRRGGGHAGQRARRTVQLPEGYSVSWSGEFENQERAMARLSVIVPISILIIFLLLFDAFKSFRSALLIILNIPFSVIGGILALWSRGSTCRCRRRSASSRCSGRRC